MILYDVAFIVFCVFYIPYSICKKGFRSFNLKARMGFIPPDVRGELAGSSNIWIHAVSVGEVMVLPRFLDYLNEQFPECRIVISTTTKTGNDVAKKIAGEGAVIIYSPLDISFAVKIFVDAIRPKILILAETEIWPNLIGILKSYKVPVAVINGRISPRSFRRYNLVKPFLKSTLKKIDSFCMQSDADASKIISIGAPAERVIVTGNMKFDVAIRENREQSTEYRKKLALSEKDILVVAGSTHKGEEEILLDVYKDLGEKFPNLRLLIAPRHIQRTPQIETLAKRKGFFSVRISNLLLTPNSKLPTVFILDTIGHLKEFYSIADIVFIGGSLIKHGGQNPIEPAYFSKPIIFGPFMFNFKYISQLLLSNAAAVEAKDKDALKKAVASLINEPKKARQIGFFAKRAIEENRGASEKNAASIKRLFETAQR